MKYVLALGLFDGVHRGHQAIMAETAALADELGAAPAVLTFDAVPKEGLADFGRITGIATQKRLFSELYSMETVFSIAFTDAVRGLSPAAFVDFIKAEYNAVGVVAGLDFRFGKDRAGDIAFLQSRLPCRAVLPVLDENGMAVSSTAIRALLANGAMEQAARLMGHPYTLCETVAKGAARGRTLGFATVNLPHEEGLLRLPAGVYASCMTLADGSVCQGVTNFGFSPTFGNGTEYRSETHLFDFSGDLYGQPVKLEVIRFLRPELKFSNAEDLIRQMKKDASDARATLKHGAYMRGAEKGETQA